MSSAGDTLVVPAWVSSPAQWAGWWLTSKARGPLPGMRDLGLAEVTRPSQHADPAWSPVEFGAVTAEQADRFAAGEPIPDRTRTRAPIACGRGGRE